MIAIVYSLYSQTYSFNSQIVERFKQSALLLVVRCWICCNSNGKIPKLIIPKLLLIYVPYLNYILQASVQIDRRPLRGKSTNLSHSQK